MTTTHTETLALLRKIKSLQAKVLKAIDSIAEAAVSVETKAAVYVAASALTEARSTIDLCMRLASQNPEDESLGQALSFCLAVRPEEEDGHFEHVEEDELHHHDADDFELLAQLSAECTLSTTILPPSSADAPRMVFSQPPPLPTLSSSQLEFQFPQELPPT